MILLGFLTHMQTKDKTEYRRSEIETKTLANLGMILDALKIEYEENGQRFFFPCPLHPSDNYNSMSIYKDTGIATCFTRNCLLDQGDGTGIFRFISAVLASDNQIDYPSTPSRRTAIEFCNRVFKGKSLNIYESTKIEKIDYRFKEIDRSLIIPYVDPNIEFYLRRGYSREILKKYDIFICKKRNNSMYGRITIPIYNDEHSKAVGFMGRSLNPRCESCKKYHPTNLSCPSNPYEHIRAEKWLNSKGLARNKLLFNYWYAKDEIDRMKSVILVESPGNTIKLVQAGFNNVLGIFGTALSKNQVLKLDERSIETVYLGLDADEAGQEATKKIREQLDKYNCVTITPPVNDYGDMQVVDIQKFLRKKINAKDFIDFGL
jgi:5S rRNA maturation endonuclease (ribonuclease M5)